LNPEKGVHYEKQRFGEKLQIYIWKSYIDNGKIRCFNERITEKTAV